MPVTPVYTTGVKYIKVAKLDSGSVDQSIQLQNLTDIRIKFTDIANPVQYNVASITEYPTYYLYSIVPLNITSSADQEILDYTISASSNTKSNLAGAGQRIFTIDNYINVTGNTLGYFTASSGYWNLGNTPNIALSVTCSVSWSWSGPLFPNGNNNISLWDTVNDTYTYLSPVPNPSSTNDWIASGSITPIENSKYVVRVDTGLTGNYTSSLYSASILITQSFVTESSNYDIVVLEPYVGANFYNSDCNVIQNNVEISTISPFYMDVDFTNSPIVAQNQAAILNGTATRAQVQQWNYTYMSQIRGRYLGKQQNAIEINKYTGPTNYTNGISSTYGYTGSWPGDTTSPSSLVSVKGGKSTSLINSIGFTGLIPTIKTNGDILIQWLDSCIYEVNWGGGGYPENTNGGGLNMGNIYLVGETKDDVAVIKPGTDIYYDILEKTFPSGSLAFQYQYGGYSSLPNQLNIAYPALGLPSARIYFGSGANLSGNSSPNPGWFFPTSSIEPYLFLSQSANNGLWLSYVTQDGYLAQSNGSLGTTETTLNIISASLAQGEKWFLSLYSGSGPALSPDTGLLKISDGSKPMSQYGYPFEISTVFNAAGDGYITLKTGSGFYDIGAFFSGSAYPLPVGIGLSLEATTGFLITKADYPNNGLTIFGVPSQNFGGTGQGYILSQYPKRVITENIDYILKTYGNKP